MEIYEVKKFSEIQGFLIPTFQRRLDEDVVNEIAEHIKDQRNKGKHPYLGAIEIAEYDGNIYIIDGQHRYEAYKKDFKQYGKKTKITILKYEVENYNEMLDIFTTRNMGVQVPTYILRSDNEKTRQLMMEIENYISGIPGFVKKETRRPNINISEFMNDLLKENVLAKNRIAKIADFADLLNFKNNEIFELLNDGNFIGLVHKGYWFDSF